MTLTFQKLGIEDKAIKNMGRYYGGDENSAAAGGSANSREQVFNISEGCTLTSLM